MIDSFISFAWIGGACISLTLVWRLFVAIEAQRQLDSTLAEYEADIDRERQELGSLMESQTGTITTLTEKNAVLHQQLNQTQTDLTQLTVDHQALQEKYVELEHSLLENLAHEKTLSEQLQTQTLEQSKLHRQVETFQKQKAQLDQAQQTLTLQHQQVNDKNQLYHKAVQAAKAKIDSLERDKKQLERDLQQALYQVVALEQAQQPIHECNANGTTIASQTLASDSIEPSLPMFG